MLHRLGLVLLAAIIASSFAAFERMSAAYEVGAGHISSCSAEGHKQLESCSTGHNLEKKQGAYSYGANVPYLNVTSTSATLTVTVTSTDVLTETVDSSPTASSTESTDASVSGYTSMSTAAVTATPTDTTHAETSTTSCGCIATPSIGDGQERSTTMAQTGPYTTANTVVSSTCTCANTPVPSEQSSSTQVYGSPTVSYATVTTTIVYSGSDCGEYAGTKTVTMTPYVTITKGTTKTLSSVTKSLVNGSTITETDSSASALTVTVYLSPLPTEQQTETVGGSASVLNVTVSEVVTATVMQTVSPVPSGPFTTKYTGSSMTNSPSTITRRSTLTITISARSVFSTVDVSTVATTLEMSTSAAAVISSTVAAGASVDTTCTKPPTPSNGTAVFSTMKAPSAPTYSAPYVVSISIHGSVRTANSTSATNTTSVPASDSVTSKLITMHTAATYTPNIHQPSGTIPTYSVKGTVPISAGESLGKKRPIKVSWGDTDGSYSQTCVILVALIVSLFL